MWRVRMISTEDGWLRSDEAGLFHAAETGVVAWRFVVLRVACRGSVAHAIGDVAEEGSALDHAMDHALVFQAGIAVDPVGGALWFVGGAGAEISGVVEVVAEFPSISCHVEEAEGVGWEGSNRGAAGMTIFGAVMVREVALPSVGHPLVVWCEIIAPDVDFSGESATCGVFPFCFRGKSLAGPFRVGAGVFVGDADDGVVVLVFDRAAFAFGVSPIGIGVAAPPFDRAAD